MSLSDTKLDYGVADWPPVSVCLLQAVQHIAVMAPPLVYVILVLQAAGAAPQSILNVVSLSFVALGIGTILQCYAGNYVGSGFLLPFIFTAAYLPGSLTAAKLGGMPLVFGMTLFGGALEIALAWIVPRMRWLFPSEISGLCVTLIALVLGILGIRLMLGGDPTLEAGETSLPEIAVGIAILAMMVGLQIWGEGGLRTYAVVTGVVVGYLASLAFGIVKAQALAEIAATPLFRFPEFPIVVPTFRAHLTIPFAVGALACCLRAMGDLTICQKLNNRDWVRPDFVTIQRGVFADGLGTVLAALIGSIGGNTYSTSVGLSSATRITSRHIGVYIGLVLISMAAFPILPAILISVPKSIMGAALVFTACFVLINGLKIVMDRMLDSRRILVIGLALTLSISRDVLPDFYARLPEPIQPFVASDLVIGVIAALVLNALFRIGIKQRESINIMPGAQAIDKVQYFLEEQGARWSARRDVMTRVIFGTAQTLEVVFDQGDESRQVVVEAIFDEYNLDVNLTYQGEPIELSDKRPSHVEIRESAGVRKLAGYLIRRNADRVNVLPSAGYTMVKLHFEH
jgi:NCS2 family nucleobase:cation symporter-2